MTILAGLLIISMAAVSNARSEDFRVCRSVHGVSDCVSYASSCEKGLRATGPDGKTVDCPKPDPKQCGLLEKLVSDSAAELRAAPESARVRNGVSGPCAGFTLATADESYSACIGRHRKGATKLFRIFNFAKIICGRER